MESLSLPWMFVGPAGVGKTRAARMKLAESLGVGLNDVYPKETRHFKVADDYDCRVYCSPYHFEIDIPDMSMQDKQILVEILSMLFIAGDVFAGLKTNKRKLVFLRRAHCISLAAAVRLRWILETCVCPVGGTGMIWLCTREITGAISTIEDIFVKQRVPLMDKTNWATIWRNTQIENMYDMLDGRMDRAITIQKWGKPCIENNYIPRSILNCYEDLIVEIIRGCVSAALKQVTMPPLVLTTWIRERVYDLLGLCQTGTEFLDGYCMAMESAMIKGYCTFNMFKAVITVIATAEPNTSYRNPISLEKMLLDICISIWKTVALESEEVLLKIESLLPIAELVVDGAANLENPENTLESTAIAVKTKAKGAPRKRIEKSPVGGTNDTGTATDETKEKPKPKVTRTKKTTVANMG